MNKATPDPETPIFGELNEELGELPEIDVHDFDSHAFEFLRESAGSDSGESAEDAPADTAKKKSATGGGRRRKGD